MPTNNAVMLSLHSDALDVLDAVAAAHNLRGRSEAVRHLCAALAPTYGCPPVQVVRNVGRPATKSTFQRRKTLLTHDMLRALPEGPVKLEWIDWYNDGKRPSPEAVSAVIPTWGQPEVAAMLAMSVRPKG